MNEAERDAFKIIRAKERGYSGGSPYAWIPCIEGKEIKLLRWQISELNKRGVTSGY